MDGNEKNIFIAQVVRGNGVHSTTINGAKPDSCIASSARPLFFRRKRKTWSYKSWTVRYMAFLRRLISWIMLK